MRVRGFCMNDAHIYCRYDQAKEEFIKVMRLHARYYDLMDIKEYYMRLSLPDLGKLDKYVDQPDKWLKALDIIKEAMKESGYAYVEGPGEAAFYGPKIDFMIKSAIGTEYTISTNQLDFLATQTFDLSLYRRGWRRSSGLCDPPRAARHARAFHGFPDRALCRRISGLAGTDPGACDSHQRESGRLCAKGGGRAIRRASGERHRRSQGGYRHLQ